jgi:hypothetical protein
VRALVRNAEAIREKRSEVEAAFAEGRFRFQDIENLVL